MIQLSTPKEILEAKEWVDHGLPNSCMLSLWLKVNLDRPGGIGTSEKAKCYVDHWPNPNIIAAVDFLEMFQVKEYPHLYLFSDLPNDQSHIIEQFLINLSNLIDIAIIGGVQAMVINEKWVSVFRKVFFERLHLDACNDKWPCKAYWFDETARTGISKENIKIPDGFVFDTLHLEDAEYVDTTWPHRSVGSIKYIKRRICDFPNVCIRQQDKPNRLVSFELVYDCCPFMNHLYTVPEFRRRGLASLVELRLAQLLVEKDYLPVKAVVRGNIGGEKVTELSKWWTYIGDVSYLRYGDERFRSVYYEN